MSPAGSAVDSLTARKTWRTVEPLHGFVYFVPEAREAYAAVGIAGGRMGYFASRAAAMGPVTAPVVTATFFNFSPAVVAKSIPAAWELASPADLVDARFRAVDAALTRALGDQLADPSVAEAAGLARQAAEAACERLEGRPLFAGHASLSWPDEPHLQLFHAQTLLREFRGDAHVALLATEGLSGIESLVVHAATGDVPAEILRLSRGWSEDEWAAAVDSVRARGWLDGGDGLVLSESGREARQRVEDQTDLLAAPAYGVLGDEGCARLRELARPLSKAVVAAGLLDASLAATLDDD